MNLPENWTYKNIEEIAEVVTGSTPSKKHSEYYENEFPFYKPTDLNAGYYTKKSADGLSKLGLENARFIPEKSILVTSIGATIGKTGLIRASGSCNQQINAIIPNKVFLPEFVYFICISPQFQKAIINNASSTTLPILNKTKFGKLKIPLPPLLEQHQIISKIEELFSELDNGIENLKKAREQLKTYRHAVLKYAFEGKLTKKWRTQQIQAGNPPESAEKLLKQIKTEREKHYKKQLEDWKRACEQAKADGRKKPPKPKKPKELPPLTEKELAELPELPEGWCWARFGQLVDNLKRGPFGSSIKKEFFVPIGIKVYEQKNAIYKSETIGDYFISDEKFEELSKFEVNAGDYIVSCSGTIGKIFRLPKNSTKGVINQALLRIRIPRKLLDHMFFQNLFESTYFQIKILKDTKGSAMVNLAGIKELELVPFAYCSLKEQEVIAQEIESRLSVCDQLEQTIEDSLKKAEALRQSILKKAFSGELTRDWREKHPELITGENSAEKLLEKIKAEKAVAAGRKKSQSKKTKKSSPRQKYYLTKEKKTT